MAMELTCGQCHGHFLAEVPGSVVMCPHCGAHLQTPGAESWPPGSFSEPPPIPAQQEATVAFPAPAPPVPSVSVDTPQTPVTAPAPVSETAASPVLAEAPSTAPAAAGSALAEDDDFLKPGEEGNVEPTMFDFAGPSESPIGVSMETFLAPPPVGDLDSTKAWVADEGPEAGTAAWESSLPEEEKFPDFSATNLLAVEPLPVEPTLPVPPGQSPAGLVPPTLESETFPATQLLPPHEQPGGVVNAVEVQESFPATQLLPSAEQPGGGLGIGDMPATVSDPPRDPAPVAASPLGFADTVNAATVTPAMVAAPGSLPASVLPTPPAVVSAPPPISAPAPAPHAAPTLNQIPPGEPPPPPARGVPSFLFVLVLSYASAVSLACYFLYQKNQTLKDQVNPELEHLPDVEPPKDKDGNVMSMKYVPAFAEMNPQHTLKFGESQRYGSVRVTPIKVVREPLEFVYFDPKAKNQQHAPSPPILKLYLKFENVSADQVFTPLDPGLVFNKYQDPRRLEVFKANQFVTTVKDKGNLEKQVLTYHQPTTSDWDLKGEKLGYELKPGETWETYIPSSDDGLENLQGDLLWRVHFRKGYNPVSRRGVTTLIEVAFNSSEIQDPAAAPAPAEKSDTDKPGVAKSAKASNAKPGDAKSGNKPDSGKSSGAKPGDNPAEKKPADTKPADGTPKDAKPMDEKKPVATA